MTKLLYDEKTGKQLHIGDKVQTFRGEIATIAAMREPHKPSSSGFVIISLNDGRAREFYPGVIGAYYK